MQVNCHFSREDGIEISRQMAEKYGIWWGGDNIVLFKVVEREKKW